MTPKRYIRRVIPFLRRFKHFILAGVVLGVALRLLFVLKWPHVMGDTFVYGDIAKNWLTHGVYGFSHPGGFAAPTLIRLPGYPAFLAACFKIFGIEHYRAVMFVQLAFDLATCFFVADLARRLWNERAGWIAFLAAALCPFTANYVAAPMPETLSLFFTTLVFWCAVMAMDESRHRWAAWAGCGTAIAACILLRPDGGILLAVVCLFLTVSLFRTRTGARSALQAMALVVAISLAPLIPWAVRNWNTFHVFQPLAPRYASDPHEFVPSGYNHWVRTWITEYVSVEDIYWQMPGEAANVNLLPARAFDTVGEKQRTEDLFLRYAENNDLGPSLDHEFEQLARDRVHRYPFRYYVRLPLMRIADMWLRPRTENLPIDSRWWKNMIDDPHDFTWAAAIGALNLAYVGLAVMALLRKPGPRYALLLVLFLLLRSAFLGTLENPEPRYTLECYSVIILLVAVTLARCRSRSESDVKMPDTEIKLTV